MAGCDETGPAVEANATVGTSATTKATVAHPISKSRSLRFDVSDIREPRGGGNRVPVFSRGARILDGEHQRDIPGVLGPLDGVLPAEETPPPEPFHGPANIGLWRSGIMSAKDGHEWRSWTF